MKKLYLILIATTLIISCENNKTAETVTDIPSPQTSQNIISSGTDEPDLTTSKPESKFYVSPI